MATVNGVTTIIPPPDGYEVDFANPQRRLVTETYVVFIVENILALAFLGQRLYTKIRLMKQFQIDDVGESRGSENKDSSGRNRGLRTWGSDGNSKRKYDTLMRTVDGAQGDGDDEIPLASVAPKASGGREAKVPTGNVSYKGDNDSEEAILYERTVQVTYEGGNGGDPANPYSRQVWPDGHLAPSAL
ncbi:hypothetical protein J4E90_007347 [Alternaria incomplexa]|uniref:uncharacterized protein n=1 Tax=Alternaria incomplexa TaxID=1187928 RepID=UPI002220527D|nr:uncharacterized protein J4E90_007347 [Alternaria incomplexa]KAI4911090.1 hypothetical protein J4E90_007347 [Alternaria incomplexa]